MKYETERKYAPPGKNVGERLRNAQRYLARFKDPDPPVVRSQPKKKRNPPFFPYPY
jgi:hypothetical protein